MATNAEGDVRSVRNSIFYDDVVSSGDLSNENVTPAENIQNRGDASPFNGNDGMQIQHKDLRGQNEAEISEAGDGEKDAVNKNGSSKPKLKPKPKRNKFDDQGSPNDRLKNRKENDKEQWTLMKGELNENKDCKECTDSTKTENDTHSQALSRCQYQKTASGDFEQKTSPGHSSEGDPIKPPRRRLPQVPNSAEPKAQQNTSSHGGDVLSVTHDDSGEQKLEEIVCKPVLTSSPNQDELPSLTVETSVMDTNRRVLSFIDVSTEGRAKKVESFYDYLYSQAEADVSVEGQTSPILWQAGDRIGSALSGSEEHLYDDVPRDSSVAQSWKSNGTYDEVIVNREAYVMPSNDDESDDYSESEPWGSDFETEDDITYAGSIRTQDGLIDEEEEEDPYDTVEISPMRERKRPFQFVSEIANFSPFSTGKKSSLSSPGLKAQFKGCLGLNRVPSTPYLASDSKKVENEESNAVYVDPDITDSVNYQQPVMPPMPDGLSNEQIKRYQIVKFMLESEADYMRLLDQLSKQYELPIRERDLLEPSKIDVIFQHVHRVLQCHAMFNIALSARMSDWTPDMNVGDILYALFCKSMVLDAYSGYVNNFAKAMDTVKVACRTHLAFAQFLKSRRQSSLDRHSLHYLMLKPIHRFPQILALLQELLVVTPRDHPDRVPLQLALTQLECLAENLSERKREAELRNKVKLLDGLVAQSHKPLASGNRLLKVNQSLEQRNDALSCCQTCCFVFLSLKGRKTVPCTWLLTQKPSTNLSGMFH
ncbi:rho guanine nucleotide exchange factor 10-like isoform X1 [Stylophora pistillata]|uniref:rho guanine nucleotide exchange factor 10-like isoform X1 n=1 Tax=Stylophora pistillata TaxID=50429 RepID=UPI000C049D73|nr:rho guanine nucleotide exchange factor 10-like isoform X1 [Stylophora pistillata]